MGLDEIWKEAWDAFRVGSSMPRIFVWKEAVEMLTDMEVNSKTFQGCSRTDGFPLGGHVHHAKISQRFETPARSLFEKHGCLEAWESINNPDALKVWTDASVTEKGAAAAILVETCNTNETRTASSEPPEGLRGKSDMASRVFQKVSELERSVGILHVDEDSQGRVQGACSTCHKSFDLSTRSFLSRGPTKCDCEKKSCRSWMAKVRVKAEELELEISHIDEEFEGKVRGGCCLCRKPFEVAIRTFIYRGPTKCSCADRKARDRFAADIKSSHPSLSPTPQRLSRPIFPPSMLHWFPVRGNSFRAEGLGLIGAKKLLVERGNLERKTELHFLCDNMANIIINKQLQESPGHTSKHSIYRENQELERELLQHWSVVKYIFVKGHVGIEQNELCDQRAKQEVRWIAEEALRSFGEVRNRGMRIESRDQLKKSRKWMDSFNIKLMGCCRTHMAKRVQIGIERWSGNTLVFQNSALTKCPWCDETHGSSFYEMIQHCRKTQTFRKEVQARWRTVLGAEEFDVELLFGKVRKTLFQRICQKREEMEVWRSFRKALKWWERRLCELRKDLGNSLCAETRDVVDDSDEDEEAINQKVHEMAQEVRVMDEGVVERGEPDTISWIEGRKEVKRFLSRKRDEDD